MRTIVGVLLLMMLTLGAFALLGYSTCNHPTQQSAQANQDADANKQNCSTFHSALTIGFNSAGTYIHEFREDVVAVGTIFIAAFTVILGFATAALYLATRDLVRGAEATAKRQLRAYVFNKGANIFGFDEPIPVVQVIIKNFGQTPAYNVVGWNAVVPREFPLVGQLVRPLTPK